MNCQMHTGICHTLYHMHLTTEIKKFFLSVHHTIFRSTEYAYLLQKHTRKCTLYV